MELNGFSPTFKTVFAKSSVRVKNGNGLVAKVKRMISDGHKKLQIVTDFDHTLSKSHLSDGTVAWSTHALFQREIKELLTLNQKYFPIEHDQRLTVEEKTPHMLRWWAEAHDYIVAAGYNRKRLEQFVAEADQLQLRDGVAEFFRLTETYKIPVVIFSAGIGDMIEIILAQRIGHMPSNVHIISNRMSFDESGKLIGFKLPLIHTFNKNTSVIEEEHEFFNHLRDRVNVLLLGDTLGDLNMNVGVTYEKMDMKVGFLNHYVDSLLNDYLDGYDAVCVADQTMDVAIAIVKEVCQ